MLSSVARAAATRKTMAKYQARAFDWRTRATCIHMARTHLRNMGHRPPPVPDFRSPRGARMALAKTGHADLAGLLDSLLPRIAPASMWLGDIGIIAGNDMLDCIGVWSGSMLLAWHPDDLSGLKPLTEIIEWKGAWRV